MILEKTCYTKRGQFYRGSVNTTNNSLPCFPWKTQPLHNLPFTQQNYPNASLISNYCRNPIDSIRNKPWCFTNQSYGQWEYCNNILPCSLSSIGGASYPLGSWYPILAMHALTFILDSTYLAIAIILSYSYNVLLLANQRLEYS